MGSGFSDPPAVVRALARKRGMFLIVSYHRLPRYSCYRCFDRRVRLHIGWRHSFESFKRAQAGTVTSHHESIKPELTCIAWPYHWVRMYDRDPCRNILRCCSIALPRQQ